MRWIFGVFGVLLGVVFATAFFGQIAHLRGLVPDRLPAWSEAMRARSGLMSGEASVSPEALGVALDLRWDDPELGPNGPSWRVVLRGDGILGSGRVLLRLAENEAVNVDARVDLDLGLLGQGLGGAEPSGTVRLDMDEAVFDLAGAMMVRLQANGQGTDLSIGGFRLGDGDIEVSTDLSGSWQVSATLDGPDLGFDGIVATVPGQRLARIQGVARPGPEISDAQRALLDTAFQRGSDGTWQVVGELRL